MTSPLRSNQSPHDRARACIVASQQAGGYATVDEIAAAIEAAEREVAAQSYRRGFVAAQEVVASALRRSKGQTGFDQSGRSLEEFVLRSDITLGDLAALMFSAVLYQKEATSGSCLDARLDIARHGFDMAEAFLEVRRERTSRPRGI